jgi:acetoacetyl-CoA reductase
MADMNGQVALVTGGIRGIGLAICERLMNRGVRVAAGYSSNAEAARQFAGKYAGHGVTIHQGNIGSDEDCARVIGEVLEQHGQLDILVNNAGITVDKTVRKMTPQEWDHVIHVNLSGAFYLSKAILPNMLDRGYGRIINRRSHVLSGGRYVRTSGRALDARRGATCQMQPRPPGSAASSLAAGAQRNRPFLIRVQVWWVLRQCS